MEIINRKVSELIPYDRNPRKNDEAVKYVKASIEQFGFKVPIVIDAQGVIVAGHTRLKAAKELGWAEVPCIVADDLNEEQIRAFRLADNKVSEASEWRDDLLSKELDSLSNLFEMSDFGFEAIAEEIMENLEDEKPEVEFSEELHEEHNYIVLYFDNDVDWINAQSFFEIKSVKELDAKGSYIHPGPGRVLKGAEAIRKIQSMYGVGE